MADRSLGNLSLLMPNVVDGEFISKILGKDNLTVKDHLDFARRYNYVAYIEVAHPILTNIAPEQDKNLRWNVQNIEDDLSVEKRCILKTSYGELKEIVRYSKENQISYYIKEMIQDKDDVKALKWVISESVRVILKKWPIIKAEILNQIIPQVQEIKGNGISVIHFWTPIHEVLYPHFSQEYMLYFLHDYPVLATELMDMTMQITELWIEVGLEADIDAMQTA